MSRCLRLGLGFLLLAAASTFGEPAFADAGPAPRPPLATADSPATAQHVRLGDKARQAGRWAEAAAAYRDALVEAELVGLPVDKRAAILGELGLSELALGNHRDAAEHLDRALKHRDALGRDQRRRFEQGQKQAEREVALLFVGVDPPDAELFIDDKPVGAGKDSYLIFLEPGSHTLRARLAGHVDDVAVV